MDATLQHLNTENRRDEFLFRKSLRNSKSLSLFQINSIYSQIALLRFLVVHFRLQRTLLPTVNYHRL